MNECKLNEIYSSLKESYPTLSKEQSAMKEENEQFKQGESNNQNRLTMEEMNKEGLTPISNVLRRKETEIDTVNIEVQIDKDNAIEEEKKVQQIKGIEYVIESERSNDVVLSLTVTEDRRIASGGEDGNISISSYDLTKKKWKREIHKEKAHNYDVYSLCPLNGNRLLSSGDGDDGLIKV